MLLLTTECQLLPLPVPVEALQRLFRGSPLTLRHTDIVISCELDTLEHSVGWVQCALLHQRSAAYDHVFYPCEVEPSTQYNKCMISADSGQLISKSISKTYGSVLTGCKRWTNHDPSSGDPGSSVGWLEFNGGINTIQVISRT